jgi:O-acetyl-ADP-ribose deacetylase (regulator of RNase III)
LTASGGSNSKYLLHVASVGSETDEEFSVVQKSIYNALIQAQKRGIKSVAAPALGTGIIGALTPTQSAKAMMFAINQFVKGGGKLDEIRFVIYGSESAQQAFVTVLQNKSYENISPESWQKQFQIDEWVVQMHKDTNANASFRRRN